MGTVIILIIIALIAWRIISKSRIPLYVPQVDISSATPNQIELATKLVDKIMQDRPATFRVGFWECDDILYDEYGYDILRSKSEVIKLAQLMVQIAKESYPDSIWKFKPYKDTNNQFAGVWVQLNKMPKELKRF